MVGAVMGGGTVGGFCVEAAGGMVGVVTGGGTVAGGGTVGDGIWDAREPAAGGFVFCAGALDGFDWDAAKPSNESAHGSVFGIVDGSGTSCLRLDDGGQAGIVCSVGGSGGQISVASGIALWAGATSSWSEIDRTCATSGVSPSSGSPGGAGTVWAQVGAGFCIGIACFGSASFSVVAQSGAVSFCIGSAGRGSASEAVPVAD